jgi:monolysocardiolipin acyltransferase
MAQATHRLFRPVVLRGIKYITGMTFVASMTTAWYYRPIAAGSESKETFFRSSSLSALTNNRNNKDSNHDNEPILLHLARYISIGVTTVAIRLLMTTYGQYTIVEDENYFHFLNTVLDADDRRCILPPSVESNNPQQQQSQQQQRRRGMITVSNHRSLFDDPGVISCLLPLHIAIQPRYNRWGICSQEYCFNTSLPGIIKGYIGAGQVLPIHRGGGIDQTLLYNFAYRLAQGGWCHVFPEGGVWQWNELGGRRQLPKNAVVVSSSDIIDTSTSNDDEKQIIITATTKQRNLPLHPTKGKLKWGVGKLIAHAPIPPVVIPFAHVGMEQLLPQDVNTGQTKLHIRSILFGSGSSQQEVDDDKLHVKICFGTEIKFDDLLMEYENKYGKLWKYHDDQDYDCSNKSNVEVAVPQQQQQKHQSSSSSSSSSEEEILLLNWKSSKEERILYNKITSRIERELDIITKEICRRQQQQEDVIDEEEKKQ